MNLFIIDIISHERNLAVGFNYAYEVIGEGITSDAIYEYGINNLRQLRRDHPEEWQKCETFRDYFMQDDWESTGLGSPRCEAAREQYLNILEKRKIIK